MSLSQIYLLLFILACPFTSLLAESKWQTSHILQTDPFFSHHVIVVEKLTHRLFLYEDNHSSPSLVKVFDIATGKSRGDKSVQGDKKTPEGIYILSNFLSAESLEKKYGDYSKIYGIGAFPLNYPNTIDKLFGKTGGGIWLHSTDDDNRVDKKLDSRGCVVLKKADLLELSKYIDLSYNTPIIIVENAHYADETSNLENRANILNFIISWQQAWSSQQLYPYISHYDSQKYVDKDHGNFTNFLRYKKNVFNPKDSPTIHFSNHSIFMSKDYAVVQMLQNYESTKLKDIGKKTLFLKKDHHYNWKIVAEYWEKIKLPLDKFHPEQRYFTRGK